MARVEGFEPANSGQTPVDANGNPVPVGVWGDSDSGVGVFATTGVVPPGVDNPPILDTAAVVGHGIQDPGVWGESIDRAGVIGRSAGSSGVFGIGLSAIAAGVSGVSTGEVGVVGIGGDGGGVVGTSADNFGVRGIGGRGPGVLGESLGVGQAGVLGQGHDFGVRGVVTSDSLAAAGVTGETLLAGQVGVAGRNDLGFGVEGIGRFGVRGLSGTGPGVVGETIDANQAGVLGIADSGRGVEGAGDIGVHGRGEFIGVQGFVASNSSSAAAVRGEKLGDAGVGFAGLFVGRVLVTGVLFKGGGGFEIDHPLDPGSRYLRHSFVESPDMLNVYSGTVTTDADGEATVTLPDYFEALNRDFRYQLTVIGRLARAYVAQEIEENRFTIRTDEARVKVCWQVTGTRQDPWAAANPIAVDAEKTAEQKGRYLHPELWGQPEEARIHPSAHDENQLHRVRELLPERLGQPEASRRGDTEEPPMVGRRPVEDELRRAEELLQRLRRGTPGVGYTPPS